MSPFKKNQVADFFLDEENPYSKKRTLKISHVLVAFAILAVVVMVAGTVLEKRDNAERVASAIKKEMKAEAGPAVLPPAAATTNAGYVSLSSGLAGRSVARGGGGGSSFGKRQYSASQLIARGSNVADTLPMGTRLNVRLIGKVESSDASNPVMAVLLEDAMSPVGGRVLPQGTTVIGSGQVDAARERLKVSFHTFVLPEGQQLSLSGIAAMPDGSTGLSGNFSSGRLRRSVSQFLGNFVGGVAQGLKDRKTAGELGLSYEPGSMKNGLLNGAAQSSLDYAKTESSEAGRGSPSITVEDKTTFVLLLEREFHP